MFLSGIANRFLGNALAIVSVLEDILASISQIFTVCQIVFTTSDKTVIGHICQRAANTL
jgi:hypothetical protein